MQMKLITIKSNKKWNDYLDSDRHVILCVYDTFTNTHIFPNK